MEPYPEGVSDLSPGRLRSHPGFRRPTPAPRRGCQNAFGHARLWHVLARLGAKTSKGAFFVSSRDRKAEAATLALHYGGSIAGMLDAHGYGPGRKNLLEEPARAHAGT